MTTNEEKTALVTGANSGIGFEASAQLVEAGFGCVILACRTLEKAETAKSKLIERSDRDIFDILAVDLDSFQSCQTRRFGAWLEIVIISGIDSKLKEAQKKTGGQKMTKKSTSNRLISKKIIITALAFGAAGWLVLAVGLFIPVIGTEVNTDPHELFVTLGAALTGPAGGAMVALIADSARPSTATKAIAVIAHILGGLWMGFAYKTLVYQRLKMPLLLAGWAGLVLVYYYLFLFPFIFLFAALGALPPEMMQFWQTTPWLLYFITVQTGIPEVLMTVIVTTIIIAALPPKYRRPLW